MSVQLEVKERAIRPRSLRNQLRHEGKYRHCLRLPN